MGRQGQGWCGAGYQKTGQWSCLAGSEIWVKRFPLSNVLNQGRLVHHDLLTLATVSPGSAMRISNVALAPTFWALIKRSCGNTYWFVLANLNAVAGDEAGFPGCVNHEEKPIEAPEEQTGHLSGT